MIGTATVETYRLNDPGSRREVEISVTVTITDPAYQGKVFRWRQAFSLTDQNGNFQDWRGQPANRLNDPQPADDDKEWYFTDEEFKEQTTDGGHTVPFYDRPNTSLLRISGDVTAVNSTYELQLVMVDDLAASGGGTVTFQITWGDTITATSHTLHPIQQVSMPAPARPSPPKP